ncbi:hypothetical protein LC653_18740 [Nostoc sp. CHAB 5784]|uniref:hypothetical protein n=1 Tax=Nostoc mirabile TaxID=2907820 RepID=UPI001E2E9113|nr:hypothetical protein [Nostoc mirabile]MCC5665902.1 hypothetical protein [Nostoc mirabile CHAB5784]
MKIPRRGFFIKGGLALTGLALPNLVQKAYAQRILEYPEAEPSKKAVIEYTAHLQDLGDTNFIKQPLLCGTTGQSRRLEGFLIRLAPGSQNVGLRYFAHIQDQGDTSWKFLNQYCGTKGQSLRLEGFAIELTGLSILNYDVYYSAHLQGTGDTPWYRNGEFCGTRGQSIRVEAISIFIADKI